MSGDYPFIRTVKSPITEQQLRPLDPKCRVVQFDSPLTEGDFIKLSRFLQAYPEVPLRMGSLAGIPGLGRESLNLILCRRVETGKVQE
jgi:hypothetical protein